MRYYRNPVTGSIIQASAAPATPGGKAHFFVEGVEVNPDLLDAETLASVTLSVQHEITTPWEEVSRDEYISQLSEKLAAAAV